MCKDFHLPRPIGSEIRTDTTQITLGFGLPQDGDVGVGVFPGQKKA
jgi:hypothetical protein